MSNYYKRCKYKWGFFREIFGINFKIKSCYSWIRFENHGFYILQYRIYNIN